MNRHAQNKYKEIKMLEYNLKILDYLRGYFTRNPDIRFWQGLFNLHIITGWYNNGWYGHDKHHEESKDTWNKLKELK